MCGGKPHTLHTENILREITQKCKRKAEISLSYPTHTLHTTSGMRILCIPKNFLKDSQRKSKKHKILLFHTTGVCGGKPHTLHTENILREITQKSKRKAEISLSYPTHTLHTTVGMRILCIPKNLQRKSRPKSKNHKLAFFIPPSVCAYFAYRKKFTKEITTKIEKPQRKSRPKLKNHKLAFFIPRTEDARHLYPWEAAGLGFSYSFFRL